MPINKPGGAIPGAGGSRGSGKRGGHERGGAEADAREDGPVMRPEGRHAAPRRTLLRRLQMPVGKAVALAAMPSAVFLGTGFTSPLAKADPQPEDRYQPGACVEMPDAAPEQDEEDRQDQQDRDEQETAQDDGESGGGQDGADSDDPARTRRSGSASESGASEETSGPDGDQDAADTGAGRDGTGDSSGQDQATGGTDTTGESASGDEEPGDEDDDESGSGSGFLGLPTLEEIGQGLIDFFTPGSGREEEASGEESAGDAQDDGADDGGDDSGDGSGDDSAGQQDPLGGDVEAPEPGQAPAENRRGEQARRDEEAEPDEEDDDPDGESDEPEEPGDDTGENAADGDQEPDRPASPEEDPFAPDEQGRVPFPCPLEGAVAGTDEQTPVTLPNDPWYLEASSLTLYGLDYHGVVNVTTADGTVKQALKFTAERIDIGDLHQIVDAPGGVRRHVGTEPGSTSTFRNGTVTMYTERLEGKLFGIIPIVFDPEHQPPIDLPIAHFTDVFVTQAGQFGGELTMTGMSSYLTNDGPTVPAG